MCVCVCVLTEKCSKSKIFLRRSPTNIWKHQIAKKKATSCQIESVNRGVGVTNVEFLDWEDLKRRSTGRLHYLPIRRLLGIRINPCYPAKPPGRGLIVNKAACRPCSTQFGAGKQFLSAPARGALVDLRHPLCCVLNDAN